MRIRRVGVCGTDLHIFTAISPISPIRGDGHELAATIVERRRAAISRSANTVSIIPYISCGTCDACRKGRTNCCRNIGVLACTAMAA